MHSKDIDEKVKLHQKWLNGKDGGERLDLTNCTITDYCFDYINLTQAIFNGCQFENVSFDNCTLVECDFSHTFMGKVSMNNATLTGTNFMNTECRFLDMKESTLDGVSFVDSKFKYANLSYSFFGCDIHPTDFSNTIFTKSVMIRVDASHATIDNVNWEDIDLSSSTLNFAIIRNSNLRGADLTKVSLFGTTIVYSNLNDTILDGAEIELSNLYATSVCNSNLKDTTINNCNLSYADFGNSYLYKTNLTNCNIDSTSFTISSLKRKIWSAYIDTDFTLLTLYNLIYSIAHSPNVDKKLIDSIFSNTELITQLNEFCESKNLDKIVPTNMFTTESSTTDNNTLQTATDNFHMLVNDVADIKEVKINLQDELKKVFDSLNSISDYLHFTYGDEELSDKLDKITVNVNEIFNSILGMIKERGE